MNSPWPTEPKSSVTIDGRGENIVTEGISTVFLVFIYRPQPLRRLNLSKNMKTNDLSCVQNGADLPSVIQIEGSEFL